MRTNSKTKTIVDVVEKVRLGDLNVYCPRRGLDWRLSCSTEQPGEFPRPRSSLVRSKSRLQRTLLFVGHDLGLLDLVHLSCLRQPCLRPTASTSTDAPLPLRPFHPPFQFPSPQKPPEPAPDTKTVCPTRTRSSRSISPRSRPRFVASAFPILLSFLVFPLPF